MGRYFIAAWWSGYCEEFYLNEIGTKYSWEEANLRHFRILFYKLIDEMALSILNEPMPDILAL